jgi:hypothetical protein
MAYKPIIIPHDIFHIKIQLNINNDFFIIYEVFKIEYYAFHKEARSINFIRFL